MELTKLIVVMAVIIAALRLHLKLWQAMMCCIGATIFLYGIDLKTTVELLYKGCTTWDNLSLLLMLYLITFLQRMLEKRSQLRLAQQDLNGIFNNRRINVTIAPVFIGLLPSAAAAVICGAIVDESAEGDLSIEEKAFVTSYFRHIPESFLPTYSAIVLMSSLSGVPLSSFTVGMLPMVAAMFAAGWWFYVRKVGRETGMAATADKGRCAAALLRHLWTLIAIIGLILIFRMNAYLAVGIVTISAFFVYRFSVKELPGLAVWAFEPMLIFNSLLVLIFKDFLLHTGVIEQLPGFFAQFPIPAYLIFSIIFFVGTLICGSQAIVAFCTTMAFTAIPNGGMPLMVLLHTSAYLAMQITPVHVCLTVIVNHFHCSLGGLIKKTIPVVCILWPVLILYYHILRLIPFPI